jgi:nucleobase:cation symporter-1, NCS1 family
VLLGNLIVLVPLLLNAHAGAKYGIPFPVFLRASFGVRGANIAALLRAVVACGWFGIQSWIGGSAIDAMLM